MGLTGASVHGGFEHLWFDVGRVKIWLRSQAACGVGLGGTWGSGRLGAASDGAKVSMVFAVNNSIAFLN